MTVHLDISQLAMDPRRSGIQRAERELIRHWPGPRRLVLCRFDPIHNGMVEMADELAEMICRDAEPGGPMVELERLRQYLHAVRTVSPERLLNPELFVDPARARYYREFSSGRSYWVVYDFLPWLHPEWFNPGAPAMLMPYLRALVGIPNLTFISEQTRQDFIQRIARAPSNGPVIPMGGDGLGLERQTFRTQRRSFVTLGTIEPRKSAGAVMRAFKMLWAAGSDAELIMVGATEPDSADELALLASLVDEPRFTHHANLSDAGLKDVLRSSRAMVFPSIGEGFGIPPIEALHAGIPVIVSADLPALSGRDTYGQIRLDKVTPISIAQAVSRMLEDGYAARMWDDAATMTVPGWADFASGVAQWVQT